ncbi:MAG TPA: alpha/beta fold hydrolase [Thermoanaerobaculia bacterium]|nr:alpha/beta fold hydrolase [Thermoanaerobaculia bacterium]
MQKNCSAIFVALILSFSWAARAESGKIYRYTSSLPDGSRAGDQLLFVSGSRVEVLAKMKSDGDALLLTFDMDGPGLAPRTMKLWQVFPDRRYFMGSVESLPTRKAVLAELFFSGRPAETVAAPVFPWTMSDALSTMNLAFAGLKDPKGSFTVGMFGLSFKAGEPPVRFSGPIKVSYVGDEERNGAPTRKYRLEGEGVPNGGGFAWVHRDDKTIEALETAATAAGKDPAGIKLQFVSAQPLDAAAWEEAKRAQLGTPEPSGPVEAADVKPHPCRVPNYEKEVLCATYAAWENHETRQGRKIGLNIVILPALGPDKQPDPIFEFGGGPGEAITKAAGWLAQSPLRQKRDIVLVDQRGTGRSNPLQCPFYGEPVDFRRAAGELFPVPLVEACREKLAKVADLSQYTTDASADDLNEVRQWLGYAKINLSGGSYGTRMAQTYWRKYPETVRTVMLTGVLPPSSNIPIGHAYAGQRALNLLVAECASQPDCRTAFPDTRADLKAIKERIDKGTNVTVTNTRTGEKQEVRPTWGLVAEGIRFLMYGPAAASLPLQIHKAAHGDLAPLVQMSIERRLDITEGLDWGMDFSVTCAEDLPFITEEMIRKWTPDTYLADYRIRQQKAVCEVWPRGKVPANVHELVRSDVPVLLISGERDPVTPPEFAEEAARFMTNHLHVVVPRGSHGAAGECTDNLIRDLTDRGSIQGLDPSCAATVYGPTQFMKP